MYDFVKLDEQPGTGHRLICDIGFKIYERMARAADTEYLKDQVRTLFLQVADLRSGGWLQGLGNQSSLGYVGLGWTLEFLKCGPHGQSFSLGGGAPPPHHRVGNPPNYLRKLPKVLAYGHHTQKRLASAFRRVMLWLN